MEPQKEHYNGNNVTILNQNNNIIVKHEDLTFEWMVVSFAAKKTMKTTNICRPIRNLDKAMMKIVTTMMKMTLVMVTLIKVTLTMITLTLMTLTMMTTTSPHCPCDSPSVQACKHVDDSPCKLPSLSIVLNNCQIVNISSLSSQSVEKVYIILIFFPPVCSSVHPLQLD